ncbi:AbiV family abortive infection protein [Chitinophaga japonensis]|uniref:AbiV family abortive infection protein n=1 Tax=Chitinophaga japonensis TaxID=104662 RepID=A0A562TCQ3_CHIJA|nr:AbiV family abortive infection protein [Chitinophaga japonensis]TWI91299.1 AbiV family abortive infection protein [Chitinophaga japonensis]
MSSDFLESLFDEIETYSGVVTPEMAEIGIKLSIENAFSLLSESRLLLNNSYYPRAIALAILAIEEKGKIEMIKQLLLYKQKVASAWQNFRDHKHKNANWKFPLLKEKGINNIELLSKVTDPKGPAALELDRIKQLCFYTDAARMKGNKSKWNWLQPTDIFTKDYATTLLMIAENFVKDDGIDWTSEALSIYKDYFTPKDGEEQVTVQKFISFYKDLENRSLISKERFINIMANIYIMQ